MAAKNLYLPKDFTADEWNELIDNAAAALMARGVKLKPASRRLDYSDSDVVIKVLQQFVEDHNEEKPRK